MMDNLINDITSYLMYLNEVCNINVSVHFERNIFEFLPESIASKILPYNCHTDAYCVMTKNADHSKCLLNQKNILKKCVSREPFYNICHAGIKEYIYPIYKNSAPAGFVASGGFGEEIPEHGKVLISPLRIMLECMLDGYTKEVRNEYNQILQFLNEYHTDVTLADMAKYFGRSTSYISHMFKKESGMTLRAYCNNLKLEDAKKLLITTELSVTEVAMNVGFNDTSYFIHLFKEKYCITPLQYRVKKSKYFSKKP